MFKFFRKIRHHFLSEGKTGTYLKYALGEILLVVVGILLALQVNNWNIERSDKIREGKYLANIVLDLKKDITNLENLIDFRKERIYGNRKIIAHMNGAPIEDLSELTKYVVHSIMELNFTPNNITFSELSNSGNLNLISDDSIKQLLLELEELYKTNEHFIEHEVFDYREYISKSVNRNIDVAQMFPVYSGQKTAEEQNINLGSFNGLFKSKEYKNGLFIMMILSEYYIDAYSNMKARSETIIKMIEKESG